MARHQNYSKRSRESRQAMVGGIGDRFDHYLDCCDTVGEDRRPRDLEPGLPQRPHT